VLGAAVSAEGVLVDEADVAPLALPSFAFAPCLELRPTVAG